MRAFFANGVKKMHVSWMVELLPTMLHLSLFLFFGGLLIFWFHVNDKVFHSVAWWIGLFLVVYGIFTLLPLIKHDSPYNSPLSTPAWFLYTGIPYVILKLFSHRTSPSRQTPMDRYRGWMQGGVRKAAEEESERLSKIDTQILDWIINALGDDESLENFFKAIPDFFNSDLVNISPTEDLRKRLEQVLKNFLNRTWLSNSVHDSVKIRRLDISMKMASRIASDVPSTLYNLLSSHRHKLPQTLEMGHTLARWCTSKDKPAPEYAQTIVAKILHGVRERKDSWVTLAASVFGLPERDLWDNIVWDNKAHGSDGVLLAIVIQVTRQYFHSGRVAWDVLDSLSKLDIRNALPRVRYGFCALWNDIVREARSQGPGSTPVDILKRIRHHYIALHQDTEAAPTEFTASTGYFDPTLNQPRSYPFCKLADHKPVSTAHASGPFGSAALPRLVHARGLVNTRNRCFANAVMQLLVHSPPFCNLFRELRDLKGQRGAGGPETGDVATPLVDATVRFLEEILVEEKESLSTQQPSQPVAAGTSRSGEEKKKDNTGRNSLEPSYLYDAMENTQLKTLLVRSCAHVAVSCY